MIWYLLYPFRGTTEPPQLSPSHPLRRAFQTHGTATARHWLLSILLTIAVSVSLCYPAIFQTDSRAAAGLRNLPKHVWTSTTEVTSERKADVEVRQVWVHGDYMNALDQRVLRQALDVQRVLVGNGFDEDPGSSTIRKGEVSVPDGSSCLSSNHGLHWGYQSPLMYWNCSLKAIEEDQDLLATINSRSSQHSGLNLTLRPSTVFAGKAFTNKKLRAADALVITFFDWTKSTLGYTWESRSKQLAQDLAPGWSVFPNDGQIFRSRLYEFRFQPMTLSDDLLLACSYLVTAAYVIWRMMKLRAFKSWFGLLITICAKMTICVIASFTICTYLGIDLARIPRPWFPGVVFCFGLGNVFRLINAVLQTPPEMPPVHRIGNALGQVGHLSLAVAFQNLILIYICSRMVTPWVADFCVFAAVTLVLDFVFHLTFFLAVLSVDVQRMELQDSLERVELARPTKSSRQDRQPWLKALREGNWPVSTRFAGTAAIISIIFGINQHFFDDGWPKLSPRSILEKMQPRTHHTRDLSSSWSPPPINQARTPAEWLRIQDHNTAREMFGFIKPHAHSFIARVYDPLLVVLNGAQGRETEHKSSSPLKYIRHFVHEHAFPAALIVVFLIAGVTLFMNYLLWTGLPDDTAEDKEEEKPLFSVRSLPTPQTLDVVRLASCRNGHLASISLDRSTSFWYNSRRNGYTNTILKTATMKPKLWPVVACAMDDGGQFLALASDNGQIGLWSITAARFVLLTVIELPLQSPVLFSIVPIHSTAEHEELSLIIVTPDGYLITVDTRTGAHKTTRISSDYIVSATIYICVEGETSLVYVSKPGEVHILPLKTTNAWAPEVVAGLDLKSLPGTDPSKIQSIYSASTLGLIFAIRSEEVEIFDFASRSRIHTLNIRHATPSSFRVLHSPLRGCSCGARAIQCLSVAYTDYDTENMIMRTYALDPSFSAPFCLGKPHKKCTGLQHTTETVHRVEPAGVWESTRAGLSVVGVRQSNGSHSPAPSSSASGVDLASYATNPSVLASKLKLRALSKAGESYHRRGNSSGSASDASSDSDIWEAWTLSATGEFRSRPLLSVSDDDEGSVAASEQEQLFVAAAGPMIQLGRGSVAVGFGNSVKIIRVGIEKDFGIGGVGIENGALVPGIVGGSVKGRGHKERAKRVMANGRGRKMV